MHKRRGANKANVLTEKTLISLFWDGSAAGRGWGSWAGKDMGRDIVRGIR